MANILITGATGFLGRSLLHRLQTPENNIWSPKRGEPITQELVEKFQPDYIYHFAAEIYDTSKMIDSNILFTYNLLEATKNIDFKCFMNIGSSSEYGQKFHPMREIDVLTPRTMYEATKGSVTLLCQAYSTIYDKPIVTVRPFSVYGRWEPNHRFIPTLFSKFKNKEEISISIGSHDFVYIDDFIDGALQVATSDKEKIKGDIVNLGTGVQYSNFEVYDTFCILFGYDIPMKKLEHKWKPYDSLNWVADISYAKEKYGYQSKYNLLEGLTKLKKEI